MKVLSVVGNRPQFIKSAPLSIALRDAGIDEVVLHTGQHYDRELSQVFFDEFDLPEPKYRLDLHTPDPDTMRPAIVTAVAYERPEWVLVFGDTNSTLAGAQAAVIDGTKLAHVEAGLRSGDLSMPEERNRIDVDAISDLLFAPDERSRETLQREEVRGRIEVVGDVMYDACLTLAPLARDRLPESLEPRGYALCTVHREANVRPERIARIAEGLNRVELPVVFPAHPRTRNVLPTLAEHIRVTEPVGYLELAALASNARVIITDSGGLQKEAYWYGVPCVTLRPSTEWVDTVEAGANVLVDDDSDAIAREVAGAHMPDRRPKLYGDGQASRRIASALYASPPE